VEADHKLAFEWYWEASMQGHIKACYMTGTMYLNGKGVEKNLVVGYCLLSIAVDGGSRVAIELKSKVAATLTPAQIGSAKVYVSNLYNGFGERLDEKEEYNEALEYYQKSLAVRLKQLGPDHPSVALSYNNIGLAYSNKGEYDQALEYYQKSLAIRLKKLGADHPDVANSYNKIGYSQLSLKNPAAALAAARKARAIKDKRLAYMLSFTSERERLAYQQTIYPYDLLGTLGSASDLAEAVLRNKGIVLASLMEDQRIAKASKDPAIKALAGQLRSAQHVLNKVQWEFPSPRRARRMKPNARLPWPRWRSCSKSLHAT
jgi:tetratricopeptide (TPR) repeat protein